MKVLIFIMILAINLTMYGKHSNKSCNQDLTYDFVVANDGSGDFLSIQAAIDAIPHLRKNRTTIFIKKGIYKEKLLIATTKTNVTLIGENRDSTIITYDDYASRKNKFGEEIGTSGSSGVFIFGDDFTAKNLTFSNTAGTVGQAVAVRVDGDKAQFVNCRFSGNQDTLYPHETKSRQYYKNCYIEGTVDFIFGWATAVFDSCEIYCKDNGYITAASTDENSKYGFVFRNCKITGNAKESTFYLGRPWRPYSKVVYIECYMDNHIKAEGWNNWGKETNEKTAYYAEYNSKGPGADPKQRATWSHQLKKEDAEMYTIQNIFVDWMPSEAH